MQPTKDDINTALRKIELSELPESHPRAVLAQQAVARFQLDRDKGEKPLLVSNVHDDKGARVLNVDEVLHRSDPHHAK